MLNVRTKRTRVMRNQAYGVGGAVSSVGIVLAVVGVFGWGVPILAVIPSASSPG